MKISHSHSKGNLLHVLKVTNRNRKKSEPRTLIASNSSLIIGIIILISIIIFLILVAR